MNKNKKWYSLFLVMLISLATVVQPIQAVAAVTALDTVVEETQAKSMETPSIDKVEEVNEVEEEETATTVSEETKATDTEESTSSEVTEETTASEEKTVESSTEATKDSKEKPKAKKAVKGSPVNIKEYLEENEKFLSDVSIKITHDNKEIDYTKDAIPSDALISLDYKFAIPERLLTLEDRPLKAGDYYEIALPEGIKVSNFGGSLADSDGIEFGTYSVVDGKIRIVFNENVEILEDIKGTIRYSERLEENIQAGENTIKIPVEDGEKNIEVIVKPNGGSPIEKGVRKADDNKTIYWDVSINKNLETLNNAVVTDEMPEGLTFKKVTIWEQKVNLNGDVISTSETPLVEGEDYKVEGDKVIFLKTTNNSYKLTYESAVDEDKIPEKGGDVYYHNTATLSNNNENKSASAETSISYGKLIHKDNPEKDNDQDGHVYKWHVEYNGGEKTLPEGNFITDKLSGDNQKYVQDSLVVKSKTKTYTKGEDYDVEFNKDNSEMKIVFKNGLTEKVDIDYKTEVPFVVDGNLNDYALGNTVTTETGISGSGNGTISREGLIKEADIDYNAKKIEWRIEVNRFKYELNNWSMSDKMTDGLTFDKSTFKIVTKNGKELINEKDYELVSTGTSFEVKLIGDFAKTKESFFVTYTTDYSTYKEDNGDRYNLFSNTATTTWLDEKNEKHTDSVTKEVPVDGRHIDNATKSGQYNATNKIITWEVIVNYNQEVLKNATISDPIKGNQEYVPDSGRLYEAIIDKNGNPTKGEELKKSVSFEDNTVFAKLPNDSSKAYMLVFETSLEGKIISNKPYENTATYENDGRKKEVSSSVSPSYGGNFAMKEGKQDEQNRNYVNWNITVNPSQSTLKNVELIDEPSPNQVIDEKSIILYGTDVASNGYIGKDEKVILERDKDYSVSLTTDNITGQQVLKINFLKEISAAYILEYRTLVNSNKAEDTVSNKFSFTGDNEESVSWETSSSSKVITSGGSAEGVSTGVKIVKLDGNSQTEIPLVGAQFELRNKQGQVLRSGETDVKGELKFGNLRSNFEYVLFETKAPKGFSVSEELRKGKIIKLEKGTELNQFETLELKNDVPRIQLEKVNAETKEVVADATFVIKNAANDFYKGFSDSKKSQWVSSEKEAKKLVSDEKGIVEVVGLEPGIYTAKEIKAPVGYDKLTKEVEFEVVDDLGWIRLKDAVSIENKEYEKTSISINKIWDDSNNQDGKRPEKIEFDLLANGKVVDTLTLGTDGIVDSKEAWTKTFDDLRKFDENMKEITYSVKEHDVSGYATADKAVIIKDGAVEVTNTHKPELTKISGTKTWADNNDQDGIRPETITVNLLADGEVVPEHKEKEVKADKEGNWSYTFENLPKFKAGKEIVYSVKEEAVKGYTSKVDGMNLTNTHKPEATSISGTKTWADNNDQDGIRPETITVNLLADGQPVLDKEKNAVTKEVKADKEGNWSYTFDENLPKFKAGKEIVYSVKEEAVKGYTSKVEGMNLTNTHKPEATSISGTKTWADNNDQDGIRPETITVNLLADGQKVSDKEVKADKEGNWSYTFDENLPKFKAGKEIVYSVEENKVEGYTSKVDGMNLTNTHKPEATSISGTKTWADNNDQDGIRPETITVNLLADGEVVPEHKEKEVRADKEGNWSYTFENLPKFKAGKEIVYSVKEKAVKGYTSKVDGMNLTNTHKPEATSISGTKTWADNNDQDGIRPETITVNLLADGEKIDEVEVNETSEWKYEFEDLPVYKVGAVKQLVEYTVTENEVKGYETTEKDNNFTNTHTPELIKVSGTKTWADNNDQDGIRPETITVNLLADGEKIDEVEVSEASEWKYEFKDLPVYKVGAVKQLVKYTVTENEVKGYETTEKDNNFTNTHTPELIKVSGTKTWADNNDQDGIRPEVITVSLLADSEVVPEHKEKEVKADKEGNWSYTFENLPKFKAGKEIVYSVKEEAVKGYTSKVDGMNLTNTHTPETTSISGTKTWADNNDQDGIRPETITVNLLADGKKVSDKEVKADKEGNWSYTFDENLPKFKAGKEIVYSVEENKVEGYTSKVDGMNLTNTHTPELIKVSGTKTWEDNNDQDRIRPEEITVSLLADGEVVPEHKEKEVKADKEGNWSYTFENLPKFKAGKEIVYSVKEEAVKGYTSKVEGMNLTNTYKPKETKVSGTKTWKDANNKDGIRPEVITVNLLADGEKIDEVEVNKASAWKYEFKDLPVNKSGKEIKYSVTENKVDGYETTIDGFNITNTHTPKKVTTSGGKSTNNKSNNNKSTNNKSGSLPKTGEAETTALVNLGVTMIVIFLMSNVWLSQRRKSRED